MTVLYIVTFGSFIGFSMALPLAIKVIFGISHVPDAAGVMQHTLNNPNAPIGADLRLDRPVRRRRGAADRRLDLRQARRLDRHAGRSRR